MESAVVSIAPLARPRFEANRRTLQTLTAAAFGQRRKMLRSSLKSLTPQIADMLNAAGIDGTRRAETLSLEEFCTLARVLDRKR